MDGLTETQRVQALYISNLRYIMTTEYDTNCLKTYLVFRFLLNPKTKLNFIELCNDLPYKKMITNKCTEFLNQVNSMSTVITQHSIIKAQCIKILKILNNINCRRSERISNNIVKQQYRDAVKQSNHQEHYTRDSSIIPHNTYYTTGIISIGIDIPNYYTRVCVYNNNNTVENDIQQNIGRMANNPK